MRHRLTEYPPVSPSTHFRRRRVGAAVPRAIPRQPQPVLTFRSDCTLRGISTLRVHNGVCMRSRGAVERRGRIGAIQASPHFACLPLYDHTHQYMQSRSITTIDLAGISPSICAVHCLADGPSPHGARWGYFPVHPNHVCACVYIHPARLACRCTATDGPGYPARVLAPRGDAPYTSMTGCQDQHPSIHQPA